MIDGTRKSVRRGIGVSERWSITGGYLTDVHCSRGGDEEEEEEEECGASVNDVWEEGRIVRLQ